MKLCGRAALTSNWVAYGVKVVNFHHQTALQLPPPEGAAPGLAQLTSDPHRPRLGTATHDRVFT